MFRGAMEMAAPPSPRAQDTIATMPEDGRRRSRVFLSGTIPGRAARRVVGRADLRGREPDEPTGAPLLMHHDFMRSIPAMSLRARVLVTDPELDRLLLFPPPAHWRDIRLARRDGTNCRDFSR
jgi:hypothetical protein